MSQKVVRIDCVQLPEGKQPGWNPVVINGRCVAFESSRFGRFEHVAFVDSETGAFLYDGIRKFDGPVNEDGHANPGVILVVVEERPDGIYLHCQEEFRPIIYDHLQGQQGVKVLGFAGGFSNKGENPSEAALRELLAEQGIEVDKASVERIGWASDNRASTETCIEVFLGKFSRKVDANPEGHEVILRTVLVRIDQFICGRDGIVNSAYAMVITHLGLVNSK